MRGLITLLTLLLTASFASADGLEVDRHSWDRGRFEMGPRLSYLSLTDVDTQQELGMGGAGMLLRWRMSRRFGLEWSMDTVMANEDGPLQADGDVMRSTASMGLGLLFYLFPKDKLQLYGLMGFGVMSNDVEYQALGESIHYEMPMAQIGLGAQYRTKSIRFDLSLRSLTMEREASDIEWESTYSYSGREARGYKPYVGDRVLNGAMLNLGVVWGMGR